MLIHNPRDLRSNYFGNSVNQCWESVTFWGGSGSVPLTHGSGSGIQLRIRLLSSLILRIQKKIFFSTFFLITCPQAHHLQSEKFNFLLEFCVKILFSRNNFSQLNTFMRKGKDPEPDPHLLLMDPGGIKTWGSGSGSGSPTRASTFLDLHDLNTVHSIRRWAGFGTADPDPVFFLIADPDPDRGVFCESNL